MSYLLFWAPLPVALAYAGYRHETGADITYGLMRVLGALMFGVIQTVRRRTGQER